MTQLNDTLDVKRLPPPPRTFSQPYWDATREKKLLIQYDPRNKKYQFFPRANSIYDGRGGLEWREVSGKGEIFTFTIARRAREPFRGHEPFLIAMVILNEGVNVMANIVHCPLEKMRIGLRVKPFWAPLSDGRNLLLFEPE